MARQNRFTSRLRSGAKRATAWVTGPVGLTAGLTGTGSSLFANGLQSTLDGNTIVRIRGMVTMQVSVVPNLATPNLFAYAVGMCVVSENAFGVGITAVPTPLTDIAWDGWMFHSMGIGGIVPGAGNPTADEPVAFEVDSKAMRKFKNTDVLIAVLEVSELGTAGTITAEIESRTLIKLH